MRLFLAFDLPAEVRESLRELQELLRRSCRGWRFVEPRGIHLTLRFLGEVAPSRDAEMRSVWREALRPFPPVGIRLGGTGVFPGRTRPRILWVGVEETSKRGVLAEIAGGLEDAARALGFAAESRTFRPHLTLARATREGRPTAPPEGLAARETEAVCEEVTLFRSELHPAGACYTALEAIPLTGPGTEGP